MKIHSACKEAMKTCIEHKSFALAHLYNDEKPMNMHIHDSYEIYFSISGGKQFLIDNHFYNIQPGDIFFINHYESHHLTQIDQELHERIVISIYPDYLKSLSTEVTNLNLCFTSQNKDRQHKLSLNTEEQQRFQYYIHKLSCYSGYGEDLMDKSTFIELMVFLNRIFYKNADHPYSSEDNASHKQVDNILSYINQNIKSALTIEELSEHFFLSPSYLCRIFKAATGTTINKYITAKRITIAKAKLSQGFSVNEACEACGFRDYSNFLKAFTKTVGISPKKYSQFTA